MQPDNRYTYGQCEGCKAKDMYLTLYHNHGTSMSLNLCAGCFLNAELDNGNMPEYKDMKEHFPHQDQLYPSGDNAFGKVVPEQRYLAGVKLIEELLPERNSMEVDYLAGLFNRSIHHDCLKHEMEIMRNYLDETGIYRVLAVMTTDPAEELFDNRPKPVLIKGTRQHFEHKYQPDPQKSPFPYVKFNEETQLYEDYEEKSVHAKMINAAWQGYQLNSDDQDTTDIEILNWGGDSYMLAAWGHVDLLAFKSKCREEFPSFMGSLDHPHYPAQISQTYYCEVTPAPDGYANWYEPCSPHAEGARAVTVWWE